MPYPGSIEGNSQLESDYAAAFDEWGASEDAAFWDRTVGDGLTDTQR
ncbi:hypothetical protein [Streptomyces spiramyceticus]|nr:hypothetical protein [Streptomyces spiramyceticus]